MTLPRSLSILTVLLGIGIGVAAAAPAGADTPTNPDTPHTTVPDVPAHCHDLGAFTSLTFTANGRSGSTLDAVAPLEVGDRVDVSWTTAPGCEAQWVWITPYDTASLSFDPAETQPKLPGSVGSALGTQGGFMYLVPDAAWPNCRIQLDAHTGPLVPVIDETHRLNAPAFGLPGFDELIGLGVYVQDDDCTEPAPPSTTTTAPPTTTTASSTPSSIPDEPLTPSTSAPTVVTATTPAPTTTQVVALLTPPQQLPFTGDHTGLLAAIGAGTVAAGAALVLRARRLS